jgi:hypothetical protein
LIEPLQRNRVSLYVGGCASGICNDGGFSWFRDRGHFGYSISADTFGRSLYIVTV